MLVRSFWTPDNVTGTLPLAKQKPQLELRKTYDTNRAEFIYQFGPAVYRSSGPIPDKYLYEILKQQLATMGITDYSNYTVNSNYPQTQNQYLSLLKGLPQPTQAQSILAPTPPLENPPTSRSRRQLTLLLLIP